MYKEKYPSIVNKSGQIPQEYIGIIFNGDRGIYRKKVLKALRRSKAPKELLKAAKTAEGDLAISRCLIEADQFDVLVNIFNKMDARTAVMDYIQGLYDDAIHDTESNLCNVMTEFSNSVNKSAKTQDIDTVLADIDKKIENQIEAACKKVTDIHTKTAKEILTKYHEACERKLEKIRKEIQDIQAEQRRLEEIIDKMS